ncbi:MAG TPA: hypothetical protein VGJ32_09425 [Solirubrobacteraceae bacterium]
MSLLRTTARDLVDRRLWPLVALLAVALVAIPVVFLRPSPGAVDEAAAPAAAPVAPAATPAAGAAVGAAAPADATADPAVTLTSSPFAAAFGAGLDLPPAMEGLLKATTGPDDREAVAGAPLRDPFAVASASSATGGSAAVAAPAASAASAPATMTTAEAAAPVSTPAPASQSASAPASDPAPAAPSTPATPVSDTSGTDDHWTIFHADVRFGAVESSPVYHDARRLTAFPSSVTPVAVFLGVMRGGWGAAFALRDGSQPTGAPSCRPRKQICTWVILHPGEEITLNFTDPETKAVTPYRLKLERIKSTVVTPDAGRAANHRVSPAGRCLLGPLAAYRYDTRSGTLAPRPELKGCRYGTPTRGDAKAASVSVAHIG